MTMVTTQTQNSENILCKANLFKGLKGKVSPGTKPAVDVCTILNQLLNVSFIQSIIRIENDIYVLQYYFVHLCALIERVHIWCRVKGGVTSIKAKPSKTEGKAQLVE